MEERKLFIQDIAEDISAEDLSIYFQSRRRSGGSDIVRIAIDKRRKYAEIEFDNASGLS